MVQEFNGSSRWSGCKAGANDEEFKDVEEIEALGLEADGKVQEFNSSNGQELNCSKDIEPLNQQNAIEPLNFPKIFQDAPSVAFSFPNDLTKICVKMAVDYCYKGQPTDLAYVMICSLLTS